MASEAALAEDQDTILVTSEQQQPIVEPLMSQDDLNQNIENDDI